MNLGFTSSPSPSISPCYLFIAVLEHVDSKLQDLKRIPFLKTKKTAYDLSLKRLKKIMPLSETKLVTRSN